MTEIRKDVHARLEELTRAERDKEKHAL